MRVGPHLSGPHKRSGPIRSGLTVVCVLCGKDSPRTRNGEVKGFNIAIGMFRFGKEKLLAEIAKCDVVCCLCHRIRTWNRAHPQEHIIRK